MYQTLHTFSGLTTAFAGGAVGMCGIIVAYYWKVYKQIDNGKRLLPLHIMAISISYSMLAVVAVARLGNPPSFLEVTGGLGSWWVYPFITFAFLLGDVALILILFFVHGRGARYSRYKHETRVSDPPFSRLYKGRKP